MEQGARGVECIEMKSRDYEPLETERSSTASIAKRKCDAFSRVQNKKSRPFESAFGAGSRGRTDTVLLPSDFESDASANSTIPA